MYELIAEGPQSNQRWQGTLAIGETYTLGRDALGEVVILWDPHISRRHVRLRVMPAGIDVLKLPTARNPVFFNGNPCEQFRIEKRGHFVIGSTAFRVSPREKQLSSSDTRPVEELTFDQQDLEKVRYRDADKRIDVLSHLPEVIWGARSETDLFHRLVNLILAGVVRAEAVAIVGLDEQHAVTMMQWDRRRETSGAFRPSSRLVAEALDHRKRSILHVWEVHSQVSADYTAVSEFDWAFCTPVNTQPNDRWGLYVAGRLENGLLSGGTPYAGSIDLQADVKFTELVAEIISNVQRLNLLERQRTGYRQFLAPPILEAMGDEFDTGLLEPRECDLTVMFCDLRGFSLQAEESAGDLLGLLDRVSRALEVMTKHIHAHDGVTGDFQGDAALGFWGFPFASDQAPMNACRAALGIRKAFAETRNQPDHPLANFQMGIGIAHGRSVAGKIGTSDQVKLTVFGPVVNLASRLESMTKQLRVLIVLDESTANIVRPKINPAEGRIRRLAKILPYGMETPVFASELLPPETDWPELTAEHIVKYETGVDQFVAGNWEEAYRCLHEMPASDRAQDFLGMLITQHGRTAPPDWDGIIRMPSK